MINCFSYQDSKLFCDFCPYETQTYRAIVRHLKRHRTCWKCSKRFFGSKFIWKRHTKSCNGLKKEANICQFCKKDLIFLSKLKKHLYKCELKHTLLKTSISKYDLWYLFKIKIKKSYGYYLLMYSPQFTVLSLTYLISRCKIEFCHSSHQTHNPRPYLFWLLGQCKHIS